MPSKDQYTFILFKNINKYILHSSSMQKIWFKINYVPVIRMLGVVLFKIMREAAINNNKYRFILESKMMN